MSFINETTIANWSPSGQNGLYFSDDIFKLILMNEKNDTTYGFFISDIASSIFSSIALHVRVALKPWYLFVPSKYEYFVFVQQTMHLNFNNDGKMVDY